MPSRRGDDLRGHIEIGIGRRFADPIFEPRGRIARSAEPSVNLEPTFRPH